MRGRAKIRKGGIALKLQQKREAEEDEGREGGSEGGREGGRERGVSKRAEG